ncbi:MAG: HAD family phosphatase [Candidatus Levybacteria bacterium]|nr:HAD family phosphatase [Candidatus Levybacteria bacterium]
MKDLLYNIKAVIFDLDGLLIDSEPVWRESDEVFRKKYNLQIPMPATTARESHGTGVRDQIRLMQENEGLQGDVDSLAEEYRGEFYKHFLNSLRFALMDGAESLLEVLKDQEMPIAIATGGHTREKVIELLKKFKLQDTFDIIVSSDEVKVGKPAPDVYMITAKKLNIDPKYCVVFEDSANGVRSGKAAGMKAIGVNSDFALQKRLEEAGADIIAPSLEVIVPLFQKGCCQGNENCACA